jgi:acetylornithine deacetylase
MNIERTVEILTDLIAMPTVSADSNLDLIEFAGELLQTLGASIELTYDEAGDKANLFATLGPAVDGGIVLSGHTDVVPVAGQPWTVDPFAATLSQERIYGRGSCDMKAFIACALAMAPKFHRADLVRPLHFALSFDEEVGCLGAPLMLGRLKQQAIRPSVCIIGEPTDMGVIEGHKGCYEYTTMFTGLEGHCSMPERGVNSVEYAVRFISRLMEIGEELKGRAPADSPYEPPWSTIQTGRISGGIARNIIPRHCEVDWEMRPVNQADARYALDQIYHFVNNRLAPEMQATHADAHVVTHVIAEVGGLEPVPHSEALRIAKELTGAADVSVVSFGTEAGLFQQMGISTVVCGPGSINQAHKPDEYVTVDQLQRCLDMIEGLIPKLAA